MREMSLRDVQMVCLDILQEFHNFCVKNNIRYSLSGGTLLGAIRHNGFIPWDDDIDVQMPRPDFEKFVRTYKSEDGHFKLYHYLLPECRKTMGLHYGRLCDMKKSLVELKSTFWNTERTGMWIDIFVCDGITSDNAEAQSFIKENKKFEHLFNWSIYKDAPWSMLNNTGTINLASKFVLKKIYAMFANHDKIVDQFDVLRRRYDYDSSHYFFACSHNGMGEWQPKKNMERFILHKFEDREFYIMAGYDENLRGLYGDYMQIPPIEERQYHSNYKYCWRE